MSEPKELNDTNLFLQRLKRLQCLCSASTAKSPNAGVSALVFIPGPDGRHNRGSFSVLKYLFQGSVGKDLFEGTFDESFECLEEIVLVIQELSVSIFLSREANELLSPLLQACPFLIEYSPTDDDEEDMDLFQTRKCEDFKRMILENVPDGGVVGIPVPLGYEDVLDTESWALLQSFALDSIVCPTGFFTQRYAVVDITEDLDILYRTVDGCYLEKAVSTLQRNVETHTEQVHAIIRNASGPSREKLSVEDALAPLEMLFEFGELDAAFPSDPSLRPRLFRGDEYSRVDTYDSTYKWKDRVVGNNSTLILESSEPSTGMRWARSLFLRRGSTFQDIVDPEALVASSGSLEEDVSPEEMKINDKDRQASAAAIGRLECIYFKLWVALRWAVRVAFLTHGDVLDAGGEVQSLLHGVMIGDISAKDSSLGEEFHSLHLVGSERLQVHMDCMNALGQIVKIEDVDDMGGLCWTYIRVSVHGIADVGRGQESSVAIGDTFLFSPEFSKISSTQLVAVPSDADFRLYPHVHDAFCLTHGVSQYRGMLGTGLESAMARRLISATKSIHILSTIGLGSVIEGSGSGTVGITMLSDHPMCPHMNAEVRLFSSGVVVDRVEKDLLPMLITFGTHVEGMWTVDIGDTSAEALRRLGYDDSLANDDCSDGYVVVLALKNFESGESQVDEQRSDSCVQYNTTERVLPSFYKCRNVAFFVPTSSRHSSVFSTALRSWRTACRMHDIPEIRGLGSGSSSLPVAMLFPVLVTLDCLSSIKPADEITSSVELADELSSHIQPYPGHGYLQMREFFVRSEALRLYNMDRSEEAEEEEAKQESKRTTPSNASYQGKRRNIVVVVGMSGSGLLSVAAQVHDRIGAEFEPNDGAKVLILDINESNVEANIVQLSQAARSADRPVVVAIIDSALKHIPITSVYAKFRENGCDVTCCIGVVSLPGDKDIWRRSGSTQFLGVETWVASTRNTLQAGKNIPGNIVVFVDAKQSASRRFHQELEVVNSAATSVTVRPHNLWLDVEILNVVMDACKAQTKGRYPVVALKDFYKCTQTQPLLRSLMAVDIILPTGVVSLERLSTLFQAIFNTAVVSNTLAGHSINLPPSIKDCTGIQFGLMLAKIKVLSKRHHDLSMLEFNAIIDAVDQDTLRRIQNSLLSAHGIVGKLGDSQSFGVIFEATPETIIARPLGRCFKSINTITLMGCFSGPDVVVLKSLFRQCMTPPVEEKKHLKPEDVHTQSAITLAQKKFGHLPLPNGWWFDGSSFVDAHGSRKTNRPDLEALLDLYLIEKNKEVEIYNGFLREAAPVSNFEVVHDKISKITVLRLNRHLSCLGVDDVSCNINK